MVQLCYMRLFFLIVLLGLHSTVFGMISPLKPLSWVEREIFLYEVNRVGIEFIVEQLGQGQSASALCDDISLYEYADIFQLGVELKLRLQAPKETLTKIIFEAISFKEQKEASPLSKVLPLKQPNNYLGNYTRYWYVNDSNGQCIKCISIFTEKEVLEDVLDYFIDKKIVEALAQIQQVNGAMQVLVPIKQKKSRIVRIT